SRELGQRVTAVHGGELRLSFSDAQRRDPHSPRTLHAPGRGGALRPARRVIGASAGELHRFGQNLPGEPGARAELAAARRVGAGAGGSGVTQRRSRGGIAGGFHTGGSATESEESLAA